MRGGVPSSSSACPRLATVRPEPAQGQNQQYNLATHAFTPERATMLELLASRAAISLENAMLYRDLIEENRQREQTEKALRHALAESARSCD
jgi:GAF domain-containing protein